ncbi:CMP-sialic acid transporter 2 [Vitis vinifera]|uniref:CMP-sialic acid transporter 2 n=1 Tax=Vitis vinifera TaxID=29760 RepID=A0A438FB70_VITVI|nr:CMP-sialic acid transporter 2 [Vitis vinifera]
MESRKGNGIKVSRGSRKSSSSRLEREIQKLECPVNYNCSLLSVREKGESNGGFSHFEVTVPSLASVFNEYALKSQFETSIYLQNLFLYGYGAIFNFLGIIGTAILKGPSSFNILQGHSRATMLLIFNNAAQGILSSFFFKYADTILKKYSSTVATIFTGIASAALFGHTLTINFILGISIVFISMHQFFSPLSKVKDEPKNGSLEMIDSQNNQRYASVFFLLFMYYMLSLHDFEGQFISGIPACVGHCALWSHPP